MFFTHVDPFSLKNLSLHYMPGKVYSPYKMQLRKHFSVNFYQALLESIAALSMMPLLHIYHITCEIFTCITIVVLDCGILEAWDCFIHICICNACEIGAH